MIQPELAQVTVKNVDDKEVTIQYNTSYTTTLDEDDDCFDAIYALSEDDYVIVTLDNNGADDATVYSAYAPTTVSGTYTKKADTKYTVGGTAYEVAENGTAPATLENDYTLYLDEFGYIVATGDVEASSSYAYIMDATREGSPMSGYTYYAKMLFADGTMELSLIHI